MSWRTEQIGPGVSRCPPDTDQFIAFHPDPPTHPSPPNTRWELVATDGRPWYVTRIEPARPRRTLLDRLLRR